jgi:hypothetical protein
MAWPISSLDPVESISDPELSPLFRPLEDLLVCGGDGRLAVGSPGRENIYGCSPFPRPERIDFASSTASSISTEALARVSASRGTLLVNALSAGVEAAFGAAVAATSATLLSHLRLAGSGTKVVFAPSGTDAQLCTLFLARALLAKPVTTIVAGSDQTGSGTAYTSMGRHFGQTTAAGWGVEKGGTITGLGEDANGVEIGFCRPDGSFRSANEMDEALIRAVDEAIGQDRSVLLQAMEASKFGWKAPSDAVLDLIAARHAGRVQIVVDACQLRTPRARLKEMLAKGYCVLITGSKFFTGPAFSGALLVPGSLSDRIVTLNATPAGLAGYSSAYDWPMGWKGLRRQFLLRPNFGQWLRWEAALEEMKLYYAVPEEVRSRLKEEFQRELEAGIAKAPGLDLLPVRGMPLPTVFGVILKSESGPLSADIVANIYHAMKRAEPVENMELRPCLLGQPVALPALGTAALRIGLSARLIRQCWSEDAHESAKKRFAMFQNLSFAVERLDRLAQDAGKIAEGQKII